MPYGCVKIKVMDSEPSRKFSKYLYRYSSQGHLKVKVKVAQSYLFATTWTI